jgi:hypothetical protein
MSTKKGQAIRCPVLALSFLQWLLGDGHCQQILSDNGEMFGASYRRSVLTEPQSELYQLQALMDARLREQGGNALQTINLAKNNRIALPLAALQELSSGQFLQLEAGTLVTLELELSSLALAPSILELSLVSRDLNAAKTGKTVLPVLKLPSMKPGERLKLRFSFPVFSDYSHVQLELQARSLLAEGEALIHHYRITTQKKERFDSLSPQLLHGELTAANGSVATLYNPLQQPGAPLAFVTQGSVYPLGNTERIGSEKSFLLYAGPGWWGGENWGRWSKQRATLNVFLGSDGVVSEQALRLTVRARAYVRRGHRQVEVWGNGELLDTWDVERSAQTFTATVPAAVLDRGMLSLNFVLRGSLSSPAQRDDNNQDQRKLGMGLIDFTLSTLE